MNPRLRSILDRVGRELDLSPEVTDRLAAAHVPLCREIRRRHAEHVRSGRSDPLVVGVNGAQGSGKTTFCSFARGLLAELHDLRTCGLSIDDLYLGREERRELARSVHPLLATRGVPGTHDVPLARELFDRLAKAGDDERIEIPSFDKAIDDRAPREDWPIFHGRPDVVVFEGWCVGTPPPDDREPDSPINALEAEEDPDGTWRRWVDERLAGDYRRWFERMDLLIFLRVPGFEQVRAWRRLQEEKLARRRPGAPGLMDEAALDRFLMHYERLTRRNLRLLPETADVVCGLDAEHRIVEITGLADPTSAPTKAGAEP